MHLSRHLLLLLGASFLGSLTSAATTPSAAPGRTERIERRIVVTSAPVSEAKKTVTWLGVSASEMSPVLAAQLGLPEGRGLVVAFVQSGSPAEKAGLQQHDVLLRLDDQILVAPRQLSVLVRGYAEGDTATLVYLRRGAEAKTRAVLATREETVDRMIHLDTGMPGPGFQWSAPDEASGPGALREFRFKFPTPGVAPTAPAARTQRVTIFRPKTNIVFSDEEGTMRLTSDDEGRLFEVIDTLGTTLFEGPVGTDEQRAALPAAMRARLEKLENMEVEAPPPPPPAPTPPALPALPGASADREESVREPLTASSEATTGAQRVSRRLPFVL